MAIGLKNEGGYSIGGDALDVAEDNFIMSNIVGMTVTSTRAFRVYLSSKFVGRSIKRVRYMLHRNGSYSVTFSITCTVEGTTETVAGGYQNDVPQEFSYSEGQYPVVANGSSSNVMIRFESSSTTTATSINVDYVVIEFY